MKTRHYCKVEPKTIKALFLFILLLLAIPVPAWSSPLVAAHYGKIAGQEIVIEISINAPPPPTLIVLQNVPSQVAVIQSQPATKSVNSSRGEIKWLLSKVKAGNLTLLLTLERPVSSDEISGEIRYREPDGGMVTMPITKQ